MSYKLETYRHHDHVFGFSEADLQAIDRRRREMRAQLEPLEAFRDVVERFYEGKPGEGDPDHDVGHIARCLVHATVLIGYAREHRVEIDEDVVYWSLVFHDIKSNMDNIPDHGEEGAKAAAAYLEHMTGLHETQKLHIINNVRWHNKPHAEIPAETWTKEFLIMTNADALELVRMKDEREIILTMPAAWDIHPTASELYLATIRENGEPPFERVLRAAIAL